MSKVGDTKAEVLPDGTVETWKLIKSEKDKDKRDRLKALKKAMEDEEKALDDWDPQVVLQSAIDDKNERLDFLRSEIVKIDEELK